MTHAIKVILISSVTLQVWKTTKNWNKCQVARSMTKRAMNFSTSATTPDRLPRPILNMYAYKDQSNQFDTVTNKLEKEKSIHSTGIGCKSLSDHCAIKQSSCFFA